MTSPRPASHFGEVEVAVVALLGVSRDEFGDGFGQLGIPFEI